MSDLKYFQDMYQLGLQDLQNSNKLNVELTKKLYLAEKELMSLKKENAELKKLSHDLLNVNDELRAERAIVKDLQEELYKDSIFRSAFERAKREGFTYIEFLEKTTLMTIRRMRDKVEAKVSIKKEQGE